MADSELGTKLFKFSVIELLVVVCHNGDGNAKAIHNVGRNEGCGSGFGDHGQCLSLDLLGNVIATMAYFVCHLPKRKGLIKSTPHCAKGQGSG